MLAPRLIAVAVVFMCACRADSGAPRPTPSAHASVATAAPSDTPGVLETAKRDLASADWRTRRDAVERLGQLRDKTAATVPLLVEVLGKDPLDFVRETAARTLGELGDARAVPVLIEALTDKSDNVRGEAANALGNLGPQAAPAIPALIEALRSENSDVYPRGVGGAAGALARIGPPAIPSLVEAGSNRVRYSLVEQALAAMGPSILPVLQEMLAAGGGKARTAAIALQLMGPAALPAVPYLAEASRAGRIQTDAFVYAVYVLGPSAKAAVPRLLELLGRAEEGAQRCSVAEALKRVGDRGAPVVQALRQVAEKEQSPLRRRCLLDAAKSLGAP